MVIKCNWKNKGVARKKKSKFNSYALNANFVAHPKIMSTHVKSIGNFVINGVSCLYKL